MGNKGRRFELDLVREINGHTDQDCRAFCPDYSGNAADSIADIIVMWYDRVLDQVECAYIEVKKRTCDAEYRTTVMAGGSDTQNGWEELGDLLTAPTWANCYVAVKFDHRELAVFHALSLEETLQTGEHHEYPVFEARLTPSDNVSMRKPTTDEWPSSRAGIPDYMELCRAIGVNASLADEAYYNEEVTA